MNMRKLVILLTALLALAGCGQTKAERQAAKRSSEVAALKRANRAAKADLSSTKAANRATQSAIASRRSALATVASKSAPAKQPPAAKPSTDLAAKNYAGTQEISVNNNVPGFSAADVSLAHGAWERYANLDSLNRARTAEAMLNQSLMPTQPREGLTWDPTGWRNKRTAPGWLYNRSHLIGFQLSGENNNPKNLITGTQSLNNPLMLAHEMDIATYLKASTRHFVRYEVAPVYRGNELVARGVHMRAQSIGDNTIRFNVYIFNVEPGYTINYADGTSQKN